MLQPFSDHCQYSKIIQVNTAADYQEPARFQYDLFRKNKLPGPNVGICSKPFQPAAARNEIHSKMTTNWSNQIFFLNMQNMLTTCGISNVMLTWKNGIRLTLRLLLEPLEKVLNPLLTIGLIKW